jgi:hypothetical protein
MRKRWPTVEVSIAVQNVSGQTTIETDASPEEVAQAVEAALAGGVLRLTDVKGRQLLVPGAALGWVQIGEGERGRVGFGLS